MGNSSEVRKGCRADAGVRDFWAAIPLDEILLVLEGFGERCEGVD